MLSVIAAFADGNLEPLFAALSPDVVWKATAPRAFFSASAAPIAARGDEGIYRAIVLAYHFTRFTPRILTAKDDQVWGVFEAEALHQPSGKYVQSDISIRWTVRDGKITEHQGFFDTAGVLMQQGRSGGRGRLSLFFGP